MDWRKCRPDGIPNGEMNAEEPSGPTSHKDAYLAMSVIYLMYSLGFNETAATLGLAASYYLLYRDG